MCVRVSVCVSVPARVSVCVRVCVRVCVSVLVFMCRAGECVYLRVLMSVAGL